MRRFTYESSAPERTKITLEVPIFLAARTEKFAKSKQLHDKIGGLDLALTSEKFVLVVKGINVHW